MLNPLIQDIRDSRILWLLATLPVLFAVWLVNHEAQTLLFVLSVLSIIPLAVLLTLATEAVAVKTGDLVGGLLNATLGNLTEMLIALIALAAGQYVLVKATIAGAIITKTLFMLGISFFTGGLRHHVQMFNRDTARLQAGLLFLATVALLMPSVVLETNRPEVVKFSQSLSVGLACLLILAYISSLIFSLHTHKEIFAALGNTVRHETDWPVPLALGTLIVVTVLTALVSDIFVESLQSAAKTFGLTQAFVGLIVVSLVGGAAEITAVISSARKNRLDLSIAIALGGASQIALFAAPMMVLLSYVVGPSPMPMQFPDQVVEMMLIAAVTAAFVTSGGRTAWFIGALVLVVWLIFAMTLYLLPPILQGTAG